MQANASNDGPPMSTETAFAYPPTPQDWARIKDEVRSLYVVEKRPLKEVRSVLRDRNGFKATERMIKARLKQWGYMKNAKKHDWYFLARIYQERREQGKSTAAFDVRNHRKTVKDLQRFIRNQGMTTDEFIREALEHTHGQPIPNYVHALEFTEPDGSAIDDAPTPSQMGTPQQIFGEPSARRHSESVDRLSRVNPRSNPRPRLESFHTEYSSGTLSPGSRASVETDFSRCNELQRDLEALPLQLLGRDSLPRRTGKDDIHSWALLIGGADGNDCEFICSRCNQPNHRHFISIDYLEPQQRNVQRSILNDSNEAAWHLPVSTREEGSWLWASRCFLSCMCLTRGDENAAEASLREASNEFERLLRVQDPLLLTAAGLIIVILHMHDQGSIAKRVMQSAKAVADKILPDYDPIRITINYLTASAELALSESGITSRELHQVYLNLRSRFPPDHPYVITAQYNYSWMLKYEKRFNESEAQAREVYKRSLRVLGKLHMQSITCKAVIAGCLLAKEENPDECESLWREVISNAQETLGRSHPYVLEAKRRLTWMIEKQTGSEGKTLQLLREVLEGRVTMLGRNHTYTLGSKVDYEKHLKQMGLWEEFDGKPSKEQNELHKLFHPRSSNTWINVPGKQRNEYPNDNDDNDDDDNDLDKLEDDEDDVIREPSPTSSNEYASY